MSSSSSASKTFVRARSNSLSLDFTASSGNHYFQTQDLRTLPDHPLKTHLLGLQDDWDKVRTGTKIHPPLACAEVAAMINLARSKGWQGALQATYFESHEGAGDSPSIKTRCEHCRSWQVMKSKSGVHEEWGVESRFQPQVPRPQPTFTAVDFPAIQAISRAKPALLLSPKPSGKRAMPAPDTVAPMKEVGIHLLHPEQDPIYDPRAHGPRRDFGAIGSPVKRL